MRFRVAAAGRTHDPGVPNRRNLADVDSLTAEANPNATVAVSARRPTTKRWPLVAVLILVSLTKALILATSGPSTSQDSPGYVEYADAILDHGRAFGPLVWGDNPSPTVVFRPPGYPLVLAAAKLMAGDRYAYLTVVIQSAVNFIAVWFMFPVALRLLRSSRGALLTVLLYLGSTSILWDNSILSDSLAASLWNVVIFGLVGHLIGCWRLKFYQYCGLGLLWGGSLWLRDVGVYFTLFPVLLFLLIAANERARWVSAMAGLAAFAVVTSTFIGGLVLLNFARTGQAFYSIAGAMNWWHPAFDIAKLQYAQPFSGDDLISRTVRDTNSNYDYEDQIKFVYELQKRCRCTPLELQSLGFAAYRSLVIHYPIAYARMVVRHFNYFALGELLTDPVATINQIFELGSAQPERRLPGLSLRNLSALSKSFSLEMLILMLVNAVAEAASAVLFSLYLFGTPYILLRRARQAWPPASDWFAFGYLWFSFVGVAVILSLVHFEARYALPIFPAGILGTVFACQCLLRSRQRTPLRLDAA